MLNFNLKNILLFQANTDENFSIEKPVNFIFKKLSYGDFNKINNQFFHKASRLDRYSNYLKNGYECYGFFNEKEVVSYFWLTIGKENTSVEVPWVGLRWILPAGKAYIWDCRTAINYRSMGLYTAGLYKLRSLSTEKHADAILIACHKTNVSSCRGIISAGFKPIRTVRVISIANKRIIFVRSKFPYYISKGNLLPTEAII